MVVVGMSGGPDPSVDDGDRLRMGGEEKPAILGQGTAQSDHLVQLQLDQHRAVVQVDDERGSGLAVGDHQPPLRLAVSLAVVPLVVLLLLFVVMFCVVVMVVVLIGLGWIGPTGGGGCGGWIIRIGGVPAGGQHQGKQHGHGEQA